MTCEESRVYLDPYLDNELDVGDILRLQSHLAGCDECRRAQEGAQALRSAVQGADLVERPSPDFIRRVKAGIRAEAKRETRVAVLRWLPVAAVLLVALALPALLMTSRLRSQQNLVAGEVLNGHLRSLQAGHLLDVPSSDQHTVKPWFQGKLDFSPPVPDLSGRGFTLIGGRLDSIQGRPVAALIYQRRKHTINLFAWANASDGASGVKEQRAQGYQLLRWNEAGMSYWVVSDLNRQELLEFARAFRDASGR